MTEAQDGGNTQAGNPLEDLLRGLGRHIGNYQGLNAVADAYRVAQGLNKEQPDGEASEILKLIDYVAKASLEAASLGSSAALRVAGPVGKVASEAMRTASGRGPMPAHEVDLGEVHKGDHVSVPLQAVNTSFFREGEIHFACTDFIGAGPMNKPVRETRLPAQVSFNPSNFLAIQANESLTTNIQVYVANEAQSGEYAALVHVLPLQTRTVVKLKVIDG